MGNGCSAQHGGSNTIAPLQFERRFQVVVSVPIWVSPDDPVDEIRRKLHAAVDSSRSGIVHNDTLLNPAHTLGDCKIKHGASLRISPDSSTTKLVKRRATASEPVRTEQELANEILPELTQQNLGALKEALGPKHIAFKDTEVQVAERTELLRAIQQRIDSGGFGDEKEMTNNFMTKMALDVQRLSAVLDSRRAEFEAALTAYRTMERREVRLTAIPMQQKHAEYGGVLGAQDPSEISSLCKTVEAVVNQGPLSVGAVVKVAVDGVFVPAQVVRKVETNGRDDAIKVGKITEDHITISTEANDERTDDAYELLAESEVLRSRLPYKKVFATPITLPRSKIYAKEKSPRQPEPTETAVALAKARGRTDTPKSVDPEYLAELMAKAERLRPEFQRRVKQAMSNAGLLRRIQLQNAPLKKAERTTQKAAEKYRGDYTRVLDLVRLTVVCEDVTTLRAAFTAVVTAPGTKLLRAKNRLHPAFDATVSAGYRDLMLNVMDEATQHVCEVQLTLKGFIQAKKGGGHAMYKVLRLIGYLEPWSRWHQGDAADAAAADRLRDGAFSKLDITGSRRDGVVQQVVPALQSPRCFLTNLRINAVAGLALADDVLTEHVLQQLAPSLEVLEARNCEATGVVPPGIRVCTKLRRLHLGFNNFDSGMPEWIGELQELRFLHMGKCGLNGPLVEAIGALAQLTVLYLPQNSLSGPIPPSLGKLSNLTELSLRENKLSGPIPDALGALTKLTKLHLYDNALSGALPPWLGQLRELAGLQLHGNMLTGPLPPSLGHLNELVVLHLERNALEGGIPDEWGNLTSLAKLYLSDNQLSGTVPSWLTQLERLREVDLGGNCLAGAVPHGLKVGHAALTLVNLEGNNLEDSKA